MTFSNHRRVEICSKDAPAPVGSYSQAVLYGSVLYISGQISIDPKTGQLIEGTFSDRVKRVMDNLKAIAVEAGTDLSQAISVSVFLTDINQFSEFNSIYETYFSAPYPARALVQVAALPKGVDVEVSAQVAIPA